MPALPTVLLAAAVGAGPASAPLLRQAGLTDGDLEDLSRGEVVARVLDTNDRSEVLSLAAVRLRASLDDVAAHLLDPYGPAVTGPALGSGPSDPDGIAGLSLDSREAAALRACRVGECGLRLSREAIERLRGVDWKDSAALEEGSRAMRGLLLEQAAEYEARGDGALMSYHDDPEPVSIAASLERLLPRFDALRELAPELCTAPARFSAGHVRRAGCCSTGNASASGARSW